MAVKLVRALLVVLVSGYVGTCLGVWWYQKRLVYFPSRVPGQTPADAGLPYQAIWLHASDHVRLQAWTVGTQPSHPWIIFCHGNGGNLSFCVDQLRFFYDLGCNVVAVDYRGYGKSEGTPDEAGLYRDAEACWTYLVDEQHVNPHHIVIMGESLGGGVACGLASQHEPAGLILQSTFCSVVDEGRHDYPWLPVGLLANQRFPNDERVARLSCPKLITHCPLDTMIPFASGQALFAAAAPPKIFFATVGGHGASPLHQEPAYRKVVLDFLSSGTGLDPTH